MPIFDEEGVRQEVRRLIADVLSRKKATIKPDDVKEGVSLTLQLGIDSLDILQILATVEKKYKMRIPEDDLKAVDDLKGILDAVRRHWPQG
ncbi:MAG: acyl carrier protein [Elusimicrobia bacterium]|nr:acyl carrier protein [Elusimicrobiota bacterium]